MGTIIYRPGRMALLDNTIQLASFATNFQMLLVKDGSSFMDEHAANLAAFSNLNEPTGAAYVRTSFSLSVFTDITKDRVYIPTTLLTAGFNLLPEDTGIIGAILYWKVGAGTYGVDATNIPMYGYELGSPHKVSEAEAYEFPLPEDGLVEMPSFGERAYIIGRKNLLEGYKSYTTGFELSLFMENSNYLTISNPSVIGDLTNEFDGAGYSRQAVTFTLTEDATRDRIVIATADKAFGALSNGTARIVGGVFSIPGAVNGVANTLAYAVRLPQPVNPGGDPFTFLFSPDGVAYL